MSKNHINDPLPSPVRRAPAPDNALPPLPPVGSKDYVAGQPIDEEEQRKTEAEAKAKQLPAADEL